MSERNIVRYTRGDLPEDTRTDWDRIDAMTEEEIESNAINDAGWTQEDEDRAELVVPGDRKVAISIRVDAEILEYFKAGGRGYQGRINDVLRRYVRRQNQGAIGSDALAALDRVEEAFEGLRTTWGQVMENVEARKAGKPERHSSRGSPPSRRGKGNGDPA